MVGETEYRKAFEKWVVTVNQAEIKWIGHSYANAYMAAQWEGWKAAYTSRDKLQSENERLRSKWRSMDIAPMDGTCVLLNLRSPLTIEKGYWESFSYDEKKGKQGMWRCSGLTMTVEPTAWMPLPERHKARAALSEGGE